MPLWQPWPPLGERGGGALVNVSCWSDGGDQIGLNDGIDYVSVTQLLEDELLDHGVRQYCFNFTYDYITLYTGQIEMTALIMLV